MTREHNQAISPGGIGMFRTTLLLITLFAVATPPAEAASVTYAIDPEHTYPSFEFPHMGISLWRGKFDRTRGSITLDREAKTGSVDIVVDTTSVNFGHDMMDKHAQSQDWFDVAKYPEATYTGTITFKEAEPAVIDGEFVFRGVKKPLKLKINSFHCIEHPVFKKEVCGADAIGELNWSEFGMKHSAYGQGEAGRVTLRIQVEAFRKE